MLKYKCENDGRFSISDNTSNSMAKENKYRLKFCHMLDNSFKVYAMVTKVACDLKFYTLWQEHTCFGSQLFYR